MLTDLGPEWTAIEVGGRPAWRHDPSGVLFRLVPGGTFQMGMSESEEAALWAIEASGEAYDGLKETVEHIDHMRPTRRVTVRSFLMARHPLTVDQVRHWLPDYEDDYAGGGTGGARLEEELDDLLAVLPFRLPSEAEWEYAARAGTTTLTYRGDGIPAESDFLTAGFGTEEQVLASENAFGLAAMGSMGELCADIYFPDYTGAPTDGSARVGEGRRVFRGGAGDFSPWQGCNEWIFGLSAARSWLYDTFVAIRPALDLPTSPTAG